MKTKTLLIILGVSAVVLGGARYWSVYHSKEGPASFRFTEQKSEVTAWKTYSNDFMGFEFQYPSDHTPFTMVDEKTGKLIPATKDVEHVVIADNENHVTCCEPDTLDFTAVYHPEDIVNTKGLETTFNGLKVKQVNGRGSLGSDYRIIRIDAGKNYITITENTQNELLDKILSTFRLTKK